MDLNNPPFAVDASVVAVNESYDNLVTSSGYPPDSVTSSGYPPDSVTSSDYHNNAYIQNSVPASSYIDNSVAADHTPADVAALMASNAKLVEKINQITLGYNDQVNAEMAVFRAAIHNDFLAVHAQRDVVQAQRDAVQAEAQVVAAQMAATIARLELLERCVVAFLNFFLVH
jgi:cytochrome c556